MHEGIHAKSSQHGAPSDLGISSTPIDQTVIYEYTIYYQLETMDRWIEQRIIKLTVAFHTHAEMIGRLRLYVFCV